MSDQKGIRVDREIYKSKAFIELSAIGFKVLFLFLTRRQFIKIKKNWIISNNGEIVFTYAEAHKKYKISKSRFQRALDDLIEHGFIDINHNGGGLNGDVTKYTISERYKDWGMGGFKNVSRPKDTRGLGFKKKSLQTGLKIIKSYSKKWNKIRKRILERDNYTCQFCEIKLSGSQWQYDIHHLLPKKMNGVDDENNLVTLCRKCHNKVEPVRNLILTL